MPCPSCGFETDTQKNAECPACGLVFEKWKKKHEPPQATESSQAVPPGPDPGPDPDPDPGASVAEPPPDVSFLFDRVSAFFARMPFNRFPDWARGARQIIRNLLNRPFLAMAVSWRKWVKTQAENPREEKILAWAVALVVAGFLFFAVGTWVFFHPRYPTPSELPTPTLQLKPGP